MNTTLRPTLIVLALIALVGPVPASFAHPWVNSFLPSRPLHGLGFGGMAAGVDSTGRIDTLLWPGPGGYDQLAPPNTDHSAPSGCQWGVLQGDNIAWLSEPNWKTQKAGPPTPESATLEMVSSAAELGASATQIILCAPKYNVVAVRLQLDMPKPIRAIAWFQQFTPVPSDRLLLPLPVTLPKASRGFASFFDPQRARVYQFRPAHPGSQDWEHARRLQKSQATPAEWSSFQDGAWSATAFSNENITCKFFNGAKDAPTEGAAVGEAGAIAEITSTTTVSLFRAEAFVALGRNRQEADKRLDIALQLGFDALQSETQSEYTALLAPAMPHLDDDPGSRRRMLRYLRVLFAALDTNSGTVLAAPFRQPPLSATWPELGAWTALAWHLSGYPDQARRQALFFHKPLQAKDGSPTPALPELLCADGSPALPSFVRNPASAAWIILAAVQLLRHDQNNSAPANALAYYNDLVLPAMEYLRRWSSPATGGPPPGFDPVVLRDTSSVSNELQYYLAVEGAFEIAALAKREPEPSWQAWQRELDALMRFRIVNEPDGWDLSPTLAAWAAMTLAETSPLRKASVRTPSGPVLLGNCAVPALSPDPALDAPDAFDSAVDLVAQMHAPAPQQ